METETKRMADISAAWDGSVVRLTFSSGEEIAYDVAAASPEMQQNLMMHGAEQKLRDAGALGLRTENGRVVRPTVAEKFAAVNAVYLRLKQNVWSMPRGETGPTGGTLFAAVQEVYAGKFADVGAFHAWVKSVAAKKNVAEKSVLAVLSREPKIAKAIEKQRKAAGGVVLDTTELLAELKNMFDGRSRRNGNG